MIGRKQDTPPSSVNGDEITGMEDEEVIYLGEIDDLQFEDDMAEDVSDQEEEDADMEPPEDHALVVFNKHVASVFCCDLHPNGKLAVSGGEDDKAYVWSVETGNLVQECIGFKDSVIVAAFSFDGAYLGVADLSGVIKVWKCSENNNIDEPWSVAFEYEADDLTWGFWHFGGRVLIVGTKRGDIYVFKIPSGETKVLQGNNVQVECGKLFKDGFRLAAGYEDGSIKIWDLKTSSVTHTIPTGVHNFSVTALDTHPENNLIASISSDGKVVLTTSNNGKVVGEVEAERDLEVVAFSQEPNIGYFALGTLTGAVSIWDVTRQMVRHYCAKAGDEGSAGVTKLMWVKDYLITGCLDGSIRVYDGKTGERKLTLTGHLSEILDFSYNAAENIILTTSDDGTARIFKLDENKEPQSA